MYRTGQRDEQPNWTLYRINPSEFLIFYQSMVGKRKNIDIVVLNQAVICINLFETNYWIKGLYVYEKKMCYKIIMPIGASYVFIKTGEKRSVSC